MNNRLLRSAAGVFDPDRLREIAATLSRNRTRTFMTAFGIFWGTAILALCIGGGHGFRGLMERNFQGFATNMGFISTAPTTVAYGGYGKGRMWNLRERDIADIRRSVGGIDRLATVQMTGAEISAGHRHTSASCIGVDPDYWRVMTPVTYSGRLLNESDSAKGHRVAVLGKNVAGELYGDTDPVGTHVIVGGLPYLVVGVGGQKSEASIGSRIDDAVWIPSSTFRRVYAMGDSYGFMIFTTAPGMSPSAVRPVIERLLRRNHIIDPSDSGAIEFGDVSQMFEMVDNVFSGIDLLMLFVGLGTLMAGVIGVGNIMWIIVRERTGEFGIRRAIGARQSDLIAQILSESMLLTTIAGLAGITFAVGVLALADRMQYDEWFGAPGFVISFGSAVLIFGSFIVLGCAAGLVPAVRAMRIRPVEAMR